MSQPPSQQPPQGGFGAPQEPPQGTPQPPQDQPPGLAKPPQTPPGPPGAPPAQPPQPPAGPPQTPPPGAPAYGYPQQPPGGQSGYGYPQQPGQAPGPYGQQAPGPYGQQPGPYGQQPGPYGQPASGPYGQQASSPYGQPTQTGYGYPQQQYPGAPAPGGSGGPFRGRTGILAAAALAVVLVVGGGVWFAVSDSGDEEAKKPGTGASTEAKAPSESPTVDEGDGKGDGREANDDLNAGRKPGEAKVAWLQKNDVDLPRGGADVHGPWFVGDLVVKAMYRGVSAYSVADGKQKWTLPLPADVCATPNGATADGKIVIGVKDGTTDKAKCSLLQMIDLNTGKAGWKKTIKQGDSWDFLSDIGLAISGDTVTVGRTNNSNAYRVSDGKELFGTPSGNCKPFAFAGGPKLIAAANCRNDDVENPQHQIQEVDPVSGKTKWTYQPPRGWEATKVYSVSPLIVRFDNEKKKEWSIATLTDSGKLRSQIKPAKGDTLTADCGNDFSIFGEKLEGCSGVAADADTFYVATKDDTSGAARTNKVIAFDLSTGKPKWEAPAPAERVLQPVGMEGGDLLLYLRPTYEASGAMMTLPPTGGKPKTLLQHPGSAGRIENGFFSARIAYAGGRSFIFSDRVSASNDKEELEQSTLLVYSK